DIEVENGFISESSSIYILNKEMQYKCKPGYATADGNSSGSITCLQNGWSAQPICIIPSRKKCISTSPNSRYKCQSYYELQGSQYWSEPPRCNYNDRNYYAKTGDTIEFMCKLGYNANTSILSFQAVCWEGILEYPRCE
uniref:Sushi domain-containing protein n=1 Tax=Cercocebus atys TaxID=9531 RepID=A0A2K5NF47_CERAT